MILLAKFLKITIFKIFTKINHKKIQHKNLLFHDVIIIEFVTKLHHEIFPVNPRRNELQRRTEFN